MAMNGQFQVATLFETDPDLVEMRKSFKPEFFQKFNQGFFYYEVGKWEEAREELEMVEEIKGKPDLPTKAILKYMEEFDYKAPAKWDGCRELIEK